MVGNDADFAALKGGWIANLDEVAAYLRTPIDDEQYAHGWTDRNRVHLLNVVEDWRNDLATARTGRPTMFKVIARWFLENDVDDDRLSDQLSQVDNAIHDVVFG